MTKSTKKVESDWEIEFLSVYSRKNEWRPDASPVDVVAFIQKVHDSAYKKGAQDGWENGMNSMGVEALKEQLRDEGAAAMLSKVKEEIEILRKTCRNDICMDPGCPLRTYNHALSDLLQSLTKLSELTE